MANINIDGLLDLLTVLSWLVTFYLMARAFIRALQEHGPTNVLLRRTHVLTRKVISALLVSVVLNLVALSVIFVQPQEIGVVISAFFPNGLRPQPLDPGLGFVVPFLERAVIYPLYRQTYSISNTDLQRGDITVDESISSRTQDGQEIFFDASVIFRIQPDRVNEVHQFWQDRYTDDFVRPLVRGAIRDAASQFAVAEIYTQRRFELTKVRVISLLEKPMADNGLILENFILRNITFPPDYAASIERKQIAEQEALRSEIEIQVKENQAEQVRKVAQGEADAVVIKAQADAEALRLVTEVLQENPDLLNYEYIKKLAPNVQLMLVPNNAPVILPLPGASLQADQNAPTPLTPVVPPAGLSSEAPLSQFEPVVTPSPAPTATPLTN
ncbi:MAG TPA: prohibitin family protein [Anaerolineae bacterium]|nr:prohibitin family protein [Anaerolineae bacterium]